ncbi:uncharacterized protein BDZ99DRAFT_126352 [Mytilinidion resinicola]|uniref:Uncharacterized protein n=1 Tax=Mytilinidion resinicola TaxID=574789 RepID=A0A6A6Z493_9PEZI|nr:uncharacterized protein BDZ99DRAFT_126352 [Mytilinidion resinicola]KAF2815961.1 hypothetical protein BDZ99DRAFT_126352 [Mytilinidion resinicola]
MFPIPMVPCSELSVRALGTSFIVFHHFFLLMVSSTSALLRTPQIATPRILLSQISTDIDACPFGIVLSDLVI